MAVCEDTGEVNFYKSATDNHGCSSLYRASGKYDHIEPMPQTEVEVASTRLDDFMRWFGVPDVDALWLDAQGAELSILKSLGDKIKTVRAIWTEIFFDELYSGQPLFPELTNWLSDQGFLLRWTRDVMKDSTGKWWWGDAFFARNQFAWRRP